MKERQLHVGIIGAGRIAEAGHIPGFLAADCVVAALCSRHTAHLTPLVERTGARTYADWHELLENEHLDAVSICTPPDIHAEIAVAALERGLHVLIEKPVTPTVSECDAILHAEDASDRIVMVAHNQRFRSQHRVAREIIAGGSLGRPIRAHAIFGHGGPELWSPNQAWYFNTKRAGHGVLLDLGYHKIDLLRWLLGEQVTRINAFGSTVAKPTAAEDNAVAIVEFSGGTLATLQASWTHRPGVPDSVTISCEHGTVFVPSDQDAPVVVERADETGTAREEYAPKRGGGPGWIPMVAAFADAIRSNGPSPVTVADARDSLDAVLEAYATMRISNRKVRDTNEGEIMSTTFPSNFLWGTATASFQIEGATKEDGRGESIWDRFAATPGKVFGGHVGDPACDSYHRPDEDIALMKTIGANAYRFSIAWPRIVPNGTGAPNAKGLDYYDRLVDGLLDAGITPFVTLYHWDLPQVLQDAGGWNNRATIGAFMHYSEHVVKRLGDRVKMWATFNEPWCVSILSHELGEHAPGLKNRRIALQVAHNVLVAHGETMPIIRDLSSGCKAGIVLNMEPAFPAMDTEADRRLAELEEAKYNWWFLNPVIGEPYPQNAWEHYGSDVPKIEDGDMEKIHQPLDYFALNYYTRKVVHDERGGTGEVINRRDDAKVNARNWEIFPEGLTNLLTRVHERAPQIAEFYVSENGMAVRDELVNGKVVDTQRIDYLKGHFQAALDAIEAGVPLKGYFVWSLMDNFEWACGYDSRFGLAYVDFDSQVRTVKDSGHWFARVARANAIVD